MADILINLQGTTFISDYHRLGNVKFLLKIKSYLINNELFGANDIRHEIFSNDYKLPVTVQYKLLSDIEHTLNFSTRWMVRYLDQRQIDDTHVLDYKEQLMDLLKRISDKHIPTFLKDNP